MHDLLVHTDAPQSKLSVLTIGHSNHPLEKFLGLLRQHGVEVLVDARSQPFSRFSPQFSRKALEPAVTDASIRYLFMGDLLGGRPEARECYGADGKVDYDRVEAHKFYQRGIERLLDGIARFRVCIMCAEEDPSHCHRRLLITRTLVRRGVEVRHIRGNATIETEDDLRAREQGGQLTLLAEAGGTRERRRR
ncbi:MAG: DUF488 domain-containing protein [Myxococcales bacterium]|nr:DUF488 domain-containing protein [Myxococcales bacterium]